MIFYPDAKTFADLCRKGKPFAAYLMCGADTLTPVSAAAALKARGMKIMLFESVDQGSKRSRYSFIAAGARESLRKERFVRGGAFDRELRAFAARAECAEAEHSASLPAAAFGIYGYLGYDAVRCFERLPDANPQTLAAPDAYFVLPEAVLLFDNASDALRIVTQVRPAPAHAAEREAADCYERTRAELVSLYRLACVGTEPLPSASPMTDDAFDQTLCFSTSRSAFCAAVERTKEYILAGDVFQVVLSQRVSLPFPQEKAFAFYRRLRAVNPSPYCMYIETDDGYALAGASPEMLFRLSGGGVAMRPIAGTRPRGKSDAEDALFAASLMADEKERAEHLMLVDLCRNDIGRIAKPGTVRVPERDVIEYYSHVMHIVSLVRGEVKAEADAFDVLRAVFPVGTVSGAPKVRAMEVIDELEPERRGFYAGGAGYFSFNGEADLCIILRTALIGGGRLTVQAGAGIVADSVPETEYMETLHKAGAVLRAAKLCLGDDDA